MLHRIWWSARHALVAGAAVTAAMLAPSLGLQAAQLAPTPTPTPAAPATDGQRGLSPGFGNVGSLSPGVGNVGSLSGPTNAAVALLRPRDGAARAEGEATLLRSGDTTVVTVNLSGLLPDTVYSGRVRAGGCDGPPLSNLEPVSGDALGTGRASSLVPHAIDTSTWWIAYAIENDPSAVTNTCGAVQADQ